MQYSVLSSKLMTMKKPIAALSLVLILSLLHSNLANAAVKAGGACSKAGTTSIASGKKFTCIKSRKKLVWNKGIKVVAGSNPTPASAPTNITDCKLPVADGRGDVSIGGWPRIDERLKSTGDVTATVVMVDFPDAPASMTPTDAFARISPSADEIGRAHV